MNPVEWAQYDVLGNSLLVWSLGVFLFFLAWAALAIVRRTLSKKLRTLAEHRHVVALDLASQIVDATKGLFLFLIAAFIGSRVWQLPADWDATLDRIAIIAFIIQAGLWFTTATLVSIEAKREEELTDNRSVVAAMDILSFVIRLAIWAFVLLLILDNLGINITALVAGLGVGGIAVALAAQNILGDLFASLSIVLDKPFVVGDFLSVGEHVGNVEKVGIKTTRLRSLSGEELVFSNNDLLNSRIRNYGRMFERRVVMTIGVTYQTSVEHLKRIPAMIRETVEAEENVRFDRSHFKTYGDFALVFETVYYVLSSDYNQYMDIQQSINLQIFERFGKEGIDFAYPTQTLFLNKTE
jgi:small-conductance mechanosensitive channel